MARRKQARRPVAAVGKSGTGPLWISIVAAVTLVTAGLIGWGVLESRRPETYATPPGATADGIAVGTGPVTVDVYLDLICPACRQFETRAAAQLDELVRDGRITLVHHPVAILDGASTTRYSTRAAAAVGAAAGSGKVPAYLQALYARQPAEGGSGLTDDELIRIAGTVGITGAGFADAVRSGTYHDWVAHVTEAAEDRGVRATPTVLVAGKPVDADPAAIVAAVAAGRPPTR